MTQQAGAQTWDTAAVAARTRRPQRDALHLRGLCGLSRVAPLPSSSPTSRARPDCSTSLVPRPTRLRWPSTGASCAKHSHARRRRSRHARRCLLCRFSAKRRRPYAAAEGQTALAEGPVRVRMGIHTGEPLLPRRATSASTSTAAARIAARRARRTGARVGGDLRTRRPSALRDIGLTPAQGPDRPSVFTSWARPSLPAAEDALPDEPARAADAARRPGSESSRSARPARRSAARHTHGRGRLGQDAPRAPGRSRAVEDYPQGVWWVSLAALRDPELVEPTIAKRRREGDLAEHLRGESTPLLLDNFEQVLRPRPGSRPCFRRRWSCASRDES